VLATVDWHIVWSRIFNPDHTMAVALGRTIYISVIAQVVGVMLGLAAALAHMSRLRALRIVSGLYVLAIRGTPVIVQIFFVYFGANLLFGVTLIPNTLDLGIVSLDGAVVAGIVALAINEGAYMREIIRSGIDAIDRGQLEAARSLGMRQGLAMRRIVLPQAARVIVPPLGNEFNNMMKTTSLLAFIGVYELFQDADVHYSNTFKPVEYFIAVACWYLLLTSVWSVIQARIERKLAVSEHGPQRCASERFLAAWTPVRKWTRRTR
jgi:polar amino acid transport system permease protein